MRENWNNFKNCHFTWDLGVKDDVLEQKDRIIEIALIQMRHA